MENNEADFASMPARALRLIKTPRQFFHDMPKTGGFVDPLAFLLVIGLLDGLITSLAMFLGVNPLAGSALAFTSLIVTPIVVIVIAFIVSSVLFVLWKLMGSNKSYETGFRSLAYLSTISPLTTLLGFFPYLNIVGLLWWFYLLVVASVQVHRISPRVAWTIFGILAVLFVLGSLKSQRDVNSNFQQHQKAPDDMPSDTNRQAMPR